MNCEDLQEPTLLHKLLNKDDRAVYNNIKECVYRLYFEAFEKFAHKQILYSYAFDVSDKKNLINYAFAEGLFIYLHKMREREFETGRAVLKTYCFAICKLQLQSAIQKHLREKNKMPVAGYEPIDELPEFGDYNEDITEEQYRLYEKAMRQIDEKCRRLIEARKLNKENKAALSKELSMAEDSIDNAAYRCTNKLKELIAKMDK